MIQTFSIITGIVLTAASSCTADVPAHKDVIVVSRDTGQHAQIDTKNIQAKKMEAIAPRPGCFWYLYYQIPNTKKVIDVDGGTEIYTEVNLGDSYGVTINGKHKYVKATLFESYGGCGKWRKIK